MQLWPNHALFIKLFNVSVFCYFCYLGQLWYMSSGDPINTEYTCQMDSGCHFLFWAVMSVPFSSVLLKLLWLCHCVICWLHIKTKKVFVDSRNLSKYDDMPTDSNDFAVIDIVGTLVPLIMCGVLFQHCQDSYHWALNPNYQNLTT